MQRLLAGVKYDFRNLGSYDDDVGSEAARVRVTATLPRNCCRLASIMADDASPFHLVRCLQEARLERD